MRLRLRSFLLPLVVGAGCAAAPTEVMLVVTSDLPVPSALDHVRIEASGARSPAPLVREYDLALPQNRLPLSLGLLPGANAGGELHVVVTGTLGGRVVVTQTAAVAFVPDEARTLPIRLSIGGGGDGGGDTGDGGGDAGDGGVAPGDGGALKRNGSACESAAACASGICVDGICCNLACTGACQSCTMAVSPGTCLPVTAGATDPHGVCVAQAPTTCGLDGFCDGAGGCRRYKAGVACGAEACDGNVYQPPLTCDGAGQCQKTHAMTCSPSGACGPGGCKPVPALATSGTADVPLVGPATTNPVVRAVCPSGAILVGFDFNLAQVPYPYVNGLRAHCGVPRVAFDGAAIVIDPGDTLLWAGPGQISNAASSCPSNQAVVGFASRHGAAVDQLALRCAPLSIDGNKAVNLGGVTTQMPVGGTGGGADPTSDCPGGMVAVGNITRSGGYMDGFAVICAKLVAP